VHGRTRLAALAGAVAASLAFPVGAHASIVKKVYEGLPTKDQKKFLAKPYEADAIDFFPHTVTIHVGDSIKFLPTAFHQIDIPPKKEKGPIALLVPTGASASATDAAGQPYWFNSSGLPNFKFNPLVVPPNPTVDYSPTKVPGSRTVRATYTGAKRVLSDIPFNAGPPAVQVKFTKAGTVTYYCDLHTGMKGVVRVLARKKRIPSAKADKKALKKQISRAFGVAKTRYAIQPPANTVYVGSAGKYGVEYFGYDPQVLNVPVGTTVTFQMTKGSFENHTATVAGAENADPEKVDNSYLGLIAQSFFDPAGFLPQGVWTSDNPANGPAVLTKSSHGNGFWNSGVLDVLSSTPDTLIPDRRQVTFGQAGTYDFYCMVHPQMHGQVVVG
jgi:plastocyanin